MSFRASLVWQFVVFMFLAATCRGEEFAMETKIYDGDGKQLQAENVTPFADHEIHDFSIVPEQKVTVFDRNARRFTLADEKHRTQASLAAEELVRFIASERARAETSNVALIRFASKPEFDVSFDEETGKLEMLSKVWNYRVETERIDAAKLADYHEFAQWFTQLNALFRPLPPGIRMELNRELFERKLFPTRVQVEIKNGGKVVVRQESRHRLIPKLPNEHRLTLEKWKSQKDSLRLIPFVEYRSQQLSLVRVPDDSKQR